MRLPHSEKRDNGLVHPASRATLMAFSDTALKTLRRMLLAVIAGLLVYTGYALASGNVDKLWFSMPLGLLLVGMCYRELRAGRIERGLAVLCWGFWAYACVLSFMLSGIRTPILIATPSAIMIVAWAQGRREMVLMVALTTLVLVIDVLAETYGWMTPSTARPPGSAFITYMAVIVNTGIIALVIAENFSRLVNNGKLLTIDLQRRLKELKDSDDALRALNNQLEQRVAERTSQYNEANQALQNLVERLELAQTELVQSEKLASLGSMVAGISHELNTPIGNVLTLTSSLEDLLVQLNTMIHARQVRRSELDELLQSGKEMAALATKSTKRAVNLMASFKQVAVDQTSEQRRPFNLFNVVEDNLRALQPTIKKERKTIAIENHVDRAIECDSFPGPLGQIIVNLTQNAILHGFEGRDSGTIRIEAESLDELILLNVVDDGIGMEPNIMVHAFDPFFTTKLGRGGSGIGLSISYRIATSILGGNLAVVSRPGQGARFTLTMPKVAPFKI